MENPITKTCTTCNQPKPIDEFVKDCNKTDGHGTLCLLCNRIRLKAYRAANWEKSNESSKRWNRANPDRVRAAAVARKQRLLALNVSGPSVTEQRCPKCGITKSADQFYKAATNKSGLSGRCKDCSAEDQKRWRRENPELAAAKDARSWEKYRERYQENYKKWVNRNREHRKDYRNEKHSKRMASDPVYRMAMALRKRVHLGLHGIRKSASTEKLLGCTFYECRKHLEAQFEPWMDWKNFGDYEFGWQIDHIVPLAAFDLSKADDQRCCFHHTNLRPLRSKENREKWFQFNPVDLEALRKRVLCLSASSSHPQPV